MSQQYVPADPGKPRPPWYKKKLFIIPAGLVAVVVAGNLVGGGNQTADTAAATATPSVAAASSSAPASVPVVTTEAPKPVETTTTAAPPKTTSAPPKTTSAPATVYKAISAREFKLLAKDPDAYAGKAYKIYGYVTQFDSATGPEGFLADTGPTKVSASDYYEFDQNSMLTGDEKTLSKIVEDDLFEAKVIVIGSYSYDTQMGGNTTVPAFLVQAITVYGSTS